MEIDRNRPVRQTFFYSLADDEKYSWSPNGTPAENMIGIGIEIPNGRTREIPIQIENDAQYELEALTMQAYWYDSVNTHYWWYEPQANLDLLHSEQTEIIGVPLVNFVRIKLRVLGPTKHYIIGSQNREQNQLGDAFEMNPRAMQGNEDGKLSLSVGSHLLPPGALISLSVHNVHDTKDLIIAGAFHGQKVRVR